MSFTVNNKCPETIRVGLGYGIQSEHVAELRRKNGHSAGPKNGVPISYYASIILETKSALAQLPAVTIKETCEASEPKLPPELAAFYTSAVDPENAPRDAASALCLKDKTKELKGQLYFLADQTDAEKILENLNKATDKKVFVEKTFTDRVQAQLLSITPKTELDTVTATVANLLITSKGYFNHAIIGQVISALLTQCPEEKNINSVLQQYKTNATLRSVLEQAKAAPSSDENSNAQAKCVLLRAHLSFDPTQKERCGYSTSFTTLLLEKRPEIVLKELSSFVSSGKFSLTEPTAIRNAWQDQLNELALNPAAAVVRAKILRAVNITLQATVEKEIPTKAIQQFAAALLTNLTDALPCSYNSDTHVVTITGITKAEEFQHLLIAQATQTAGSTGLSAVDSTKVQDIIKGQQFLDSVLADFSAGESRTYTPWGASEGNDPLTLVRIYQESRPELKQITVGVNPKDRLTQLLNFAKKHKHEILTTKTPQALFGITTSDTAYDLSSDNLFTMGLNSPVSAQWADDFEKSSLKYSQISPALKDTIVEWTAKNMVSELLQNEFQEAVQDKSITYSNLQGLRDAIHQSLIRSHEFALARGEILSDEAKEEMKARLTRQIFDHDEVQNMIASHVIHFAKSLPPLDPYSVCFYPDPIDNKIKLGIRKADGKVQPAEGALANEEWTLSVTTL